MSAPAATSSAAVRNCRTRRQTQQQMRTPARRLREQKRPRSPAFRTATVSCYADRLRDVAVGEVAAARAVLLVGLLDLRDAVGDHFRLLLRRELVEPRVVAAEDRVLDRAVGRAERRVAVFLLHVFRDLEPAQRLDLPLRRAGPHRVGAPHDVVGAQALDQRAHDRRAEPRIGGRRPREELPEVAVDVLHAVLLRDLGEVGDPFDAAGLLEMLPRVLRARPARSSASPSGR